MLSVWHGCPGMPALSVQLNRSEGSDGVEFGECSVMGPSGDEGGGINLCLLSWAARPRQELGQGGDREMPLGWASAPGFSTSGCSDQLVCLESILL